MFTPIKERISYGGAIIGLEEVKAIMDCILTQGGTRWTVGENSVLFEKELAQKTGETCCSSQFRLFSSTNSIDRSPPSQRLTRYYPSS